MTGADAFEERVISVLSSLARGEVVSYGEVAAEAGRPRAARAVGRLLSHGVTGVPWWRVVRADGSLAAPHRAEQARRLGAEGITVRDGRIRPWPPG